MHREALALLMQPKPRNHPFLRFNFNSTTHASAVSHMKDEVAKRFMGPVIWEAATKLAADPEFWRKTLAGTPKGQQKRLVPTAVKPPKTSKKAVAKEEKADPHVVQMPQRSRTGG